MVRIMVALFVSLTIATPVSAAGFARVGTWGYTYEGIFTGVRQTSLGQADMAGAFGPGASLINTAPLPLGDGVEAAYDRNPFLADTDLSVWGAAVETGGLRLGFSQLRFSMDPQMVRTAYNPEGTGETFDAGDQINVVSLGYDLGRLVDDTGQWAWTLGAAWRGYDSFLADSEVNAGTFDLGTSVGWTHRHDQGWTRLMGALSWQNVGNTNFDFDGRESALPGSIRMGFSLELAFGEMAWGGEAMNVRGSYSRRFAREEWYNGMDTDHFGLEMIAAGLLAFRMGHNSRLPGDLNSWGVGLILGQDFMGRFTVTADWGGYDTLGNDVRMWSLRARYSF